MLPTAFRNGTSLTPIEGVFNRLMSLDRAFGEDGAAKPTWTGAPISIWQDEDRFYVEVELPGVTDSDIEMTVHRGELTIQAERKAPENRPYLFNNRQFGQVRRTITLPDEVNSEAVEATFVNGVLSLVCPKRAESKPRKIQVKPN